MTKPEYLAPYVRSFFEDYLSCRCNMSRNTIQSYRDALKLLLRFASGQLKKAAVNLLVTDVTEPLLIAFLTDLEQARGNSIQTRNHRLVGIRRLFEYIAEREPLLLDHCHKIVAVPKKRGAVAPALKEDAQKTLLHAHQKAFLQDAETELARPATSAPSQEPVAAEMQPYLDASKASAPFRFAVVLLDASRVPNVAQ